MGETYDELREVEEDFRGLVSSISGSSILSLFDEKGERPLDGKYVDAVLFKLVKNGHMSLSLVEGEETVSPSKKMFRIIAFTDAFKSYCEIMSVPEIADKSEDCQKFSYAFAMLCELYSTRLKLSDNVLQNPLFIKFYESSRREYYDKIRK